MDSLTQIALGASVGVAVMGRRTAVWKAALWGGVCGTLPDLDALIDHGDVVRNMTLHRGPSHALFWLTLAAPLLAAPIARLHGEWAQWRRWWLAVWAALVTHPLLDVMTVYGTRLALPFDDHPYAVGSVFIIDPAVTLPLLAGVAAALRPADARGRRWNAAGLALACAYLGWSVAAQQHVRDVALRSLQARGIAAEQVLVTPTPFNTVLWRVVAIDGERWHEGFRSLLDEDDTVRFDAYARSPALREALRGHEPVERMAQFTQGVYAMAACGGAAQVCLADLRMGQAPYFSFVFAVGERSAQGVQPRPPRSVGGRPDVSRALRWLWRRLGDETLPSLGATAPG